MTKGDGGTVKPWWNVALPVVVAGSGVTAAVVATVRSDDPSPAPVAVWFDAPADLATVTAGPVVVQAHTAADVDALTLTVDGQEVATDDQLILTGDLRHAELTWDAVGGTHELQVSAGDARSDVRVVVVDDSSTATTTPPTTVPPTSTSVAATTTSSSTTSTTTPATTAPAVVTTQAPATTAPPSTIPKPTIGAVTASVDGSCGLTVSVTVGGATSGTVRFTNTKPTDLTSGLNLSASPATATFNGGDFFISNTETVPSTITITVIGPGGTTSKNVAYTLPTCKL